MFNFFRPFIFKFSPEVAHSLAIKALKLNNFPIKKIVKSEILQTNFFGKYRYDSTWLCVEKLKKPETIYQK